MNPVGTTGGDNTPRLPERFILRKELGRGGMSRVFHATDTTLLKEVAIKVLNSSVQREPQQLMRFQREAKITGNLKHRNILEIFDFGMTTDGEPYIVMDYVLGEPLSEILERVGPVPEHQALPVMFEILDAVEYAHKQGVLHRDLKPGNILVSHRKDEPDVIKLIDFGIAKFADPDQSLTGSGGLYGSPTYMSPEQSKGSNVDERSDIYALGCVFFRILAGQAPFEAETAFEVLRMHCDSEPPKLKEVCPQHEFSAEIQSLVSKCLQKLPEKRFQTAAEIKASLNLIDEQRRASRQKEAEPDTTPGAFHLADRPDLTKRALPQYTRAVLTALIIGVSVTLAYFTIKEQISKEADKPVTEHVDDNLTDLIKEARGTEPSFKLERDGQKATIYAQFPIDENDMKELQGRSDFTKLKLRDKELTGVGLKYVTNRHLKHLDMTNNDLNDDGCREIAKLTSLETLDVNGCRFTNDNVRMLEPLVNLEVLNLTPGAGLDRRGFALLGKLPDLKNLSVDGKMPPGAAEELARLPNFQNVDFYDCPVEPADLEPFQKKVGQAMSFNFTNVKLSDQLLTAISKLKLERLGFGNVNLTERSFMRLAGMDVKLIALNHEEQVTKAVRDKFRKSILPRKVIFLLVEGDQDKPRKEKG